MIIYPMLSTMFVTREVSLIVVLGIIIMIHRHDDSLLPSASSRLVMDKIMLAGSGQTCAQ